MNSQTVLLVDKKDTFLGYASREETHSGRGKRHRAFVTLLFDKDNNVILHKRKHRLFDGLWDLTAISHPLKINGRDESYQEGSDRALSKEMGIGHVQVDKMGAFNYFAKDGQNCENEYCAILIGNYNGKIKPNKKEVYEAKKVTFDDFVSDCRKNPKKYTPWARLAVKKLDEIKPNMLSQDLKNFLNVFEPYFEQYFKEKIRSGSKYSPLIGKFYKDLADFSRGGKRMRAFLVWLGYRLAGGEDLNKILPVCLASEIVHSFLLIHDDIIDKSDTRRGKATIHKRYEKYFGNHYGASQAIIIGDIACFEAIELVNSADFSDSLKRAGVNKLINVLLETAYGEALDVQYSFETASLSKVAKVADLKTARYSFVGPLAIGSIFANVSQNQLKAFADYGVSVGIAFQLQDDILSVFGDEKVIGKSVLSDMREGKNTILVYKARQMVKGRDKSDLERLWGKKNADISDLVKMRRILERADALSWSNNEGIKLSQKAKKVIGRITVDKNLAQILVQIADFVIARDK